MLKSWAVPKGLPEEPGIKGLLWQSKIIRLITLDFRGVIPERTLWAGIVEIWDNGEYENRI